MRFWILHSGDVPIQDQIVAQVTLGILTAELAPGERLPSVRELARRFDIHANTVSLAYRRLERGGWLESRHGSGMYVRKPATQAPVGECPAAPAPAEAVAAMLASVLSTARSLGLTADDLRSAFEQAMERIPAYAGLHTAPTAFVLFEPDPALERIVLAELAPGLRKSVSGHTWPATLSGVLPQLAPGVTALVLPSKAANLRAALPQAVPMHVLRLRSVPQSLAQWLPAPTDALVGVASHWPPFLEFARTLLVAAGFSADALLLRDAGQPAWQNGLAQTDAVVCDTHTATLLPRVVKTIPFRLLADEVLSELQSL